MATLTERLAVVIDAVDKGAGKTFREIGASADKNLGHAQGQSKALAAESSRTGRALDKLGISGANSGALLKAGIVGGAAAGGAALVKFSLTAVHAASDLGEQVSATNTLFGDAAEQVQAFGKTAASSLGISNRAALEAANAFGDFFLKTGFSSKAAATFSEDLVHLAADFASFKNLDPGEVMAKLKSGLAGESEPLRDLGIFINDAAVQAKGLELGLVGANGKMDEGAKIAARYALIMDKAGSAIGDVTRTGDSLANQQRKMSAQLEDLQAQIGQALLPTMAELAGTVNDTIKPVSALVQEFNKLPHAAEGLSTGFKAALGPMGLASVAFDKLKGKHKETADSSDYLSDSQKLLTEKTNAASAAALAQEQALKRTTEQLDAMLNATIAQFDSEVGFQRQLLTTKSAITDYTAALKLNSDGKKGNNVSADELRAKELDLQSQLLSTGAAAVKQAEDHAAAAGTTLSQKEKYDIFRGALVELAKQFPAIKGEVQGYIDRLKSVPDQVNTVISVNISQAESGFRQAERDFRNTQRLFADGITGTVRLNYLGAPQSGSAGGLDTLLAPRRANGGPVAAGMLYRVNERGPEFFRPNVSGRIIPAQTGGDGAALLDAMRENTREVRRLQAVVASSIGDATTAAVLGYGPA